MKFQQRISKTSQPPNLTFPGRSLEKNRSPYQDKLAFLFSQKSMILYLLFVSCWGPSTQLLHLQTQCNMEERCYKNLTVIVFLHKGQLSSNSMNKERVRKQELHKMYYGIASELTCLRGLCGYILGRQRQQKHFSWQQIEECLTSFKALVMKSCSAH